MRLLVGHDDAVANWVGFKVGYPIHQPYRALGWIDDSGTLRTGFVFFRYIENGNMDFTLATTCSLTRRMLRAAAHYAFIGAGCRRLTSRPLASNKAHCEMLKRVGFTQEAVCKHYFAHGDAVQFRLLKKDCRWL